MLYPALPGDPGHAIWRRDMAGASGLFGVVLRDFDEARTAALLNALKLFGLGFSWGGFESLAIPTKLRRSVLTPPPADSLIRIHAGLEDPADLIADLDQAFASVARP